MAMGTQWTYAGQLLTRMGLRYESLPVVAAGLSIPWPLPDSGFADIRMMEAEALSAWSRRNPGA